MYLQLFVNSFNHFFVNQKKLANPQNFYKLYCFFIVGPAQFECGCHEGYGLVGGATCVELLVIIQLVQLLLFNRYREGRFSQAEADEKLADYIDGKDWKKYIGHNSGRYIQILVLSILEYTCKFRNNTIGQR